MNLANIFLSIIFVHGLGAFPDTTWRKQRPQDSDGNSSSSTEVSWVRDLLPDDLPQSRLMYFNYDSTSYNDASQKELEDFALELLNAFDISQLRTTEQVGHTWAHVKVLSSFSPGNETANHIPLP